MMRHLVRHASEQEALGARHPLVADDDQVRILLLGHVEDGVVYGALVGFGFSMAENADYLTVAAVAGGPAGLARATYVRGIVPGLNHAVFTATVGAGLAGGTTAWGRSVCFAIALSVATLEHAIWNGFVSVTMTEILCNAATAGTPCRDPDAMDLFVVAPLIAAFGWTCARI